MTSENSMQYNFISLFPKAVSSTPVSYEASQVLRINVEFNYDRYVVGAAGELGAGGDKLKDIADTSDDALYSKAYRDATRTSGNSEILPSGLSQYFTSPNAFKSFREQLTNQTVSLMISSIVNPILVVTDYLLGSILTSVSPHK